MTDTSTRTRTTAADYSAQLEKLEQIDAWLEEKLETGRVRSVENAKARQGYIRLRIRAISEWRKLAEARDLEALAEEIEELKERQKVTA